MEKSQEAKPAAAPVAAAAASFVAVALLQGAISHVGGALMSKALGEANITDVKGWIREAVAELEAFIARKLDEKTIEEVTADVTGIGENLKEYAALQKRSKVANRDFVQNANFKTAHLIPLALSYEQAFYISFAAMGYRMISLFELYKLDHKDAGHITPAKEMIDNFFNKQLGHHESIMRKLDPKTRIKVSCTEEPGRVGEPGNESPGFYWCEASLDGHTIPDTFFDTEFNAEKGSTERRSRDAANAKYLVALTAKRDDYYAVAARLFNDTAKCYDAMCRKVGNRYTPPQPLPPDTGKRLPPEAGPIITGSYIIENSH